MFGQNTQDQQQPWQPPQNDNVSQNTVPADPVVSAPAGFSGGFTPPPSTPPVEPTSADPVSTPKLPAHGTVSTDDLLQIKQDALQELSPLVGHLEQAPEEKFKTTMMMIQAADDHTLLQAAYDAAKQITDQKARAQALLDVVNEINYFTQQHEA